MKKNSVPVSIVILTHRHDSRFEKALASAQPASEILVMDYDSHNNWDELKKKYRFSVIPKSGQIHNFATERNYALQHAHEEWVFFLDSDEEIVPTSWPALEKALDHPTVNGFWVKRKDVFYGKVLRFGETGNQQFLRLVRKKKTRYIRPVHETATVMGKTASAPIELLHFSHQNISEFLRDITRYAAIEAEYQSDNMLSDFSLGIKTLVYPKGKFFVNYFLKLGFLDGWRGLVYAVMMSLHSLMVRVFSYENS